MRVRFHPAAELELSEAADFYDRENEGLGVRLIAKVRIATDLACRYLKMAPRAHGAVRPPFVNHLARRRAGSSGATACAVEDGYNASEVLSVLREGPLHPRVRLRA